MAEPKKGIAYEFYLSLTDIFDPQFFILNPTIEIGDFTISKDGGVFGNLATIPAASPLLSSSIKINLSAAEMTADKVVVKGKDSSSDQWGDIFAFIDNPVENPESVFDLLEGDHRETSVNLKIFKKGTATILLEKNITGSLLRSDITVSTLEP